MAAATELSQTHTFAVDREHGMLRLAVVITFVVGGVLGYLFLTLVIPGAQINLLAIGGAFLIGYGLAALLERTLKHRWPSGRAVEVDERGVRVVTRGGVEQAIAADAPVVTLFWRFQTRRRSRVPKGWSVLAVALQQDDRLLSVYTFASPDGLKRLDPDDRFRLLTGSKNRDADVRGRDAIVLAGEQRRLMEAENHRWQHGAEMTVDDFQTYLATLSDRFPEWMRLP